MKTVVLSVLKRLALVALKPPTFRQAMLLSIFLHCLFATLASFFLTFYSSLPDRQPLVFDFVYMPTEQSGRQGAETDRPSGLRADELEHRAKASGNEVVPRLKASPQNPEPVNTLATRAAKDKFAPASEAAIAGGLPDQVNLKSRTSGRADPGKRSKQGTQGSPQSDRQISTLSALSAKTFRVMPDAGQLTPTPSIKLAASMHERKMLNKKLRQWAEDYHKMKLPDSTVVWEHRGKTYVARFEHQPAKSSTDIDQVHINISTRDNGMALSMDVQMRRLAFSNFAQFVDRWDPWVAVHDDELVGRFHANSKINIADHRGKKPKFYGKVTTASYEVQTTSRSPFFRDKSIFLGGLETGVKAIKLPRVLHAFSSDSTLVDEQIHEFYENTWLTFHADGSYSWRTIGKDLTSGTGNIPKRPLYIIGAAKRRLHVKGVVKGTVLIYSRGKVIIDGDFTYSKHPDISNVANDYIGIVSDNNIEIAKPSVTGPGDLEINGALYAKRSFVVTDLYGNGKATLQIYGSLTAGSLSATEPRYATHVQFDKRLQRRRPPNFPMTNRYEISKWDATWEIGGDTK